MSEGTYNWFPRQTMKARGVLPLTSQAPLSPDSHTLSLANHDGQVQEQYGKIWQQSTKYQMTYPTFMPTLP